MFAAARIDSDRRVASRTDVSLKAHVKMIGLARRPCMVRNISVNGALLEFDANIALPPTFRLDIDEDLFEVMCEVRHQSGRRVGVQFTSNRQGAMAKYG